MKNMALEEILGAAEKFAKVRELDSNFRKNSADTPVYQPLIELAGYTAEQVEALGIRPEDEQDHSSMKRYQPLKIAMNSYAENLIGKVQNGMDTALSQYSGDYRGVLANVLLSADNKLYEGLGEDVQEAHKKALRANAILTAKAQGNYALVDREAEVKVKENRTKKEAAIQKAKEAGHEDIAYIAESFLRDDETRDHLLMRKQLLEEAQADNNRYIEMIEGREDFMFKRLYNSADEGYQKQMALMLGEGLLQIEQIKEAKEKEKKKAA